MKQFAKNKPARHNKQVHLLIISLILFLDNSAMILKKQYFVPLISFLSTGREMKPTS